MGTVIGSTWKDVSYMRALAINVSNPRTPKQQKQRGKFAVCMNFLTAITPYLRQSYRTMTQNRTAFNAAMSYLLRHAITGEAPDLKVDYERALVARGTLMPAFNPAASVAEGKVTFTWKDNSGMGDALGTDLAMPLIYNKKKGVAVYTLSATTRATGKAVQELPGDWTGDALAVYLAFGSEDGKRMSNSICLRNDAYEGGGSAPAGGGVPAAPGGGSGAGASGGEGGQTPNPLG